MICTDRHRHAGIEGSDVPDVKAERATKRAAKKALREAHGACLQAMQTAVRTHAISHDAALAHVLHMAIDDAVPPTGMASALLDLPAGESRSAFPARDGLIAHAASGLDAARGMALALAIARGERALTTDSFRWREMVSAHARLIRTTGIHQLTAVEEEVLTERGLSR